MLGAVVLEHAAQVAQAREREQVAEEDRRAQQALDEPEEERRVELVLDQRRQPDGDQEEQPDRQQDRDDDRARPTCRRRSPASSSRQLRVGGDAERSEADLERLAERDDAADDRQAQHAMASERRSSGSVTTSISPARRLLGSSPSLCVASCSAEGLRTATAHVLMPRIITPSSTAWPPTGASRRGAQLAGRGVGAAGLGRLVGDAHDRFPRRRRMRRAHAATRRSRPGALAARRWKRSTRPPVSTSF